MEALTSWKKRRARHLSKALTSVKALKGSLIKEILLFSDLSPQSSWREWADCWGNRLIFNERIEIKSKGLDRGDLYLYSGEDEVAPTSRLEVKGIYHLYWGDDGRLRIFREGERIDLLDLIKEMDGNKNKDNSRQTSRNKR